MNCFFTLFLSSCIYPVRHVQDLWNRDTSSPGLVWQVLAPRHDLTLFFLHTDHSSNSINGSPPKMKRKKRPRDSFGLLMTLLLCPLSVLCFCVHEAMCDIDHENWFFFFFLDTRATHKGVVKVDRWFHAHVTMVYWKYHGEHEGFLPPMPQNECQAPKVHNRLARKLLSIVGCVTTPGQQRYSALWVVS